ncbi:EI24 domain-containing protein [Campylobacter majalis]|uniref:EI24 domain-containing protein n=1 Tax=Campylobacter majalis TaxID=2790656 RepID=UPI003D688584
MIEIFSISLRDFWTKKFIKLTIMPLILSILLLGFAVAFSASSVSEALIGVIQTGDFGYFNLSDNEIFKIVVSSAILKWFMASIFYLFGAYLVLIVSVFVALFVVGFFTPLVVKEINARHYGLDLSDLPSTTFVMRKMIVEIFKFLGILVVSLPFLVLPFLNFIAISVPFFYLYYKFLLIDVASNVLNDIKFRLALLEGGTMAFAISCLVFYILCLVPFVGLFFQLFFIIFLTHLLFYKYHKVSPKLQEF